MTSLQCSSSLSQLSLLGLRRSDRKKTKKIYKDEFMLPNPFKVRSKKHTPFTLPQNLDCQIQKMQFLTQKTLSMLNYGKQQFSIQMLKSMKQVVNQQQIKLSEFLSIKLIGQKNTQQNKTSLNLSKNQRFSEEKQNTPVIQQNTIVGDYHDENEFYRQVLGIANTQEIYIHFLDLSMQDQDNTSSLHQESGFGLVEVPRFRKESSKLLSDNYENNQLFYTTDHMIPNWHNQQMQLPEQQNFLY